MVNGNSLKRPEKSPESLSTLWQRPYLDRIQQSLELLGFSATYVSKLSGLHFAAAISSGLVLNIMSGNRGKFLVDSRVQLSLVRRVVVHWLCFIVLFLLIVLTLEMFLREPGVGVFDSLATSFKKNALLLVLMVAVMPAFLYDTVKMSNRFAGPISRLKHGLSELANGKPVEQINFRKGDFWGELAEDFNRVAGRLTPESVDSEQPTPADSSEVAVQSSSDQSSKV